jgi:NTE family protein
MEENKSHRLKLGVALGGGSALGFAHIGVLKALEENNVSIDCISGTSAGAVMGALFAFGVSFADIEREAKQLNWRKLTKLRPSSLGITTNAAIREVLERHIGVDADITDAKIPLAIITTDIETGAKITFKSGKVIDAVLASSCLPGLFSPIEISGCMLVDGGIVENVPITPLKGLGADITVGVNLLRYRKYKRPKNMMDVLLNSFDMINHRISAQPRSSDANILIEPDLSEYFMGDIKKWKDISEQGYNEALKHVSIIKELQKQTPAEDFWYKIKKLFFN